MKIDSVLRSIIDELKNKYHCHTVILYGSRARGDYTAASDYDVAGIIKSGEKVRIARFDDKNHVYLDLFIYPESLLSPPAIEHTTMADGVVVMEEGLFGSNLLAELKRMLAYPEKLPSDELKARKVWYDKMLARAAMQDVEGKYRHIWAIFAILEDYFVFRNMPYQGPKQAFQYLRERDRSSFVLFETALNDTNNLDTLANLLAVLPDIQCK